MVEADEQPKDIPQAEAEEGKAQIEDAEAIVEEAEPEAQAEQPVENLVYEPIDFDTKDLNLDQMRRKHAFFNGERMSLDSEYDTQSKKQVLKNFHKLGDVLPITPIEPLEETKFDYTQAANKEELLSKFRLINKRTLDYSKPLLIIYNPNSGKKTDLRPRIEERLTKENIPYELKPTQQYLDTFIFAKEMDVDKYSVVVAAGGDGTYHEVVNGMLARDDKRKIPVALVPNGSGNDLCSALGIMTLEDALENICKRTVISIDTTRVLMDHDSEETLPEGLDRIQFCRHMMINSTCSMPAVIANAAKPFKACCGKTSYSIATLLEACKGNFVQDFYELEIDGKRISMEGQQQERISSSLLMVCNGKYTGGGMIINPFACMNDGMVDATWIHDPNTQSLTGVAGMLDKASKKGGVQIYDKTSTYMRGKKITLRFVGKNIRNQREDYGEQLFGIDGEDLRFTRQISWECIHNNVEVLFDTENYWRDQEFKIEQQQQAKQEEADPALLSKDAAPEDQA